LYARRKTSAYFAAVGGVDMPQNVPKKAKTILLNTILRGNFAPTAKIFYFIKHTITMQYKLFSKKVKKILSV
jgi:hypothetical protein